MKKDMYLPLWVLLLGIVFLAAAVVFGFSALSGRPVLSVGCLFGLGFGVSAVLCWKNQWVSVINDSEFVYSTMFGKRITYRFDDITDIKQNADSLTLILKTGKVHIESCAVISPAFSEKIISRLELE